MAIAIFPGSFDPYTIGHHSVVERALGMFSKIVIAIGINESKHTMYSVQERKEAIERLYAGNDKIEVVAYSGLTIDLASSLGADYLLRGVRSLKDFEYERTIADVNRSLTGIETVLLYTLPEHSHISSSIVRELLHFGQDVTPFLPSAIEK